MFGMAGETEFDVRFRIFGIPVRIHPIFWLSSALLVWNGDRLDLVFVGILCVLVSVLVHELGHAIMSRRYGYPSEIVLYFMGGYATTSRFPTWQRIAVTAAGPGIGLLLFASVYGLWAVLIRTVPEVVREYEAIGYAIRILLFANLVWNIMNLVPCLPLDGGQIMQALVFQYGGRQAVSLAMKISIAASAAVAVWAIYCIQQEQNGRDVNLIPLPQALIPDFPVALLQPGANFLAFFFGYLCAQNVIAYNDFSRR
jgi:stage IV sporulation protein FB